MTRDDHTPTDGSGLGAPSDEHLADGGLGSLSALLDAPEHRPGFWADLRADLRAESAVDIGGSRVEDPATAAAEPISLSERRSAATARRRSPRWLAAVAAAVLAVVGAGVLLVDRADRADRVGVATDPDQRPGPDQPGPDQPDPVTADGPVRVVGDPVERGDGRVLGVDPTGRFVYFAAIDTTAGGGCEGAARQGLYVEPVGGGERLPAAPIDLVDATGGIELLFGPDGRVAVSTQCEGYGGEIVLATVGADGRLEGGEVLPLAVPDGRVETVFDLVWRNADELVVALAVDRSGVQSPELYSVPLDGAPVEDLGQPGVLRLDIAGDGRLLTVTDEGAVAVDGRVLATVGPSYAAGISRDGADVLVGSNDGLLRVDPDTGAVTTVLDRDVAVLRPLATGGFVVLAYGAGDVGLRALWLDPSGAAEPVELTEAGDRGVGVAVTPDGGTVFASLEAPTPDEPTATRTVELRISR